MLTSAQQRLKHATPEWQAKGKGSFGVIRRLLRRCGGPDRPRLIQYLLLTVRHPLDDVIYIRHRRLRFVGGADIGL